MSTTPHDLTGLDLYDAVLAHITDHRAEWDQGVWLEETECGTIACFAGWAVVVGGGDREAVPESALALLELEPWQAESLFSSRQTFDGLLAWRQILAPGRTDLSGRLLRGARLRGANLRGARLHAARLREADLRWADLRGTDLRWADLRDADLSDADLSDADLSDADLSDAAYDDTTVWAAC